MTGRPNIRAKQVLLASLAVACLLPAAGAPAKAAEYTFTTYGLGGTAFGAGVTPPAGTYVSTGASFYRGSISGNINIGGVVFNAGAKAEILAGVVGGLYVRDWTVLGGRLGLGVTVPVGHVDLEAKVYTTLIDKTPLIINLRHYEEYSAERRISGSMSIATVTIKF